MLRNLATLSFLFSFSLIVAFKPNLSGEIAIKVEIIGPIKTDGLQLKIDVKNLSNKKMTVLKERRWDYKWETSKSLGNYIVEIEKAKANKYQLFPASGDIDPVPRPGEYIKVVSLNTITDTLYIDGDSFSRFETGKKGFPPGCYRLRVSFNSSEWSSSQENSSEWISFEIE